MGHIYKTFRNYIAESAEDLIDVISLDPVRNARYIKTLKDKYGVDFHAIYKDQEYLSNIDLSDIKTKKDFINFDNYREYALLVFRKRGIPIPDNIDKFVSIKQVGDISRTLGFKLETREYNGAGNYASFDLIDTITIPPNGVDINTLIHEIGHYFDHNISGGYTGLAKTITYASSPYHIKLSNEVFAENFKHYFTAPKFLKKWLPEVYAELDKKIPINFKKVLRSIK